MNLKLLYDKNVTVKHINASNPIDISDGPPSPPTNQWIPALGLKDWDHNILLSRTAWLSDSIINAAQMLLTTMTPIPGFQSVLLGSTMTFNAMSGDFIQVLFDGSSHWLTISTISAPPATVFVYDSPYSRAGSRVQGQIASILATSQPEITLNFIDVPLQSGTNDCGLFAISFALCLVLGRQPEEYQFNKSTMRPHLIRCLERQEMTMFPILRMRRVKHNMVRAVQTFKVYCICRMPSFQNMIECTHCKEWYHLSICVGVPDRVKNPKQTWLCGACMQ